MLVAPLVGASTSVEVEVCAHFNEARTAAVSEHRRCNRGLPQRSEVILCSIYPLGHRFTSRQHRAPAHGGGERPNYPAPRRVGAANRRSTTWR